VEAGNYPRQAVAISRYVQYGAGMEGSQVGNMFAMMALQIPSGLGSALSSPLVMMVIVMGIFYVMLILPQQRQRKKLQEMLSTLKAGDKVITNGGIYGVINGIDGDTVILKIADTGSSPVKIRIARSAITQVEASEDAK
jgi:preprotein translocase subunit YajC